MKAWNILKIEITVMQKKILKMNIMICIHLYTSDTILLADVFENFRKIWFEIHELEKIFSSRFSMASSYRKDFSRIRTISRH